MNNFENINVLITGASGGIGTSLSKAFSSTKANLFLLGSSDEKISILKVHRKKLMRDIDK